MTAVIPVSNGKAFALVDDEDFEFLSQFKWRLSAGYAKNDKSDGKMDGKRKFKSTLMHRLVNNTPEGCFTDHINRNPLDNRKCNLRTCTSAENQRNHGKKKITTSSQYTGVSWDGFNKKWRSSIKAIGKSIFLGRFNCEIAAACAYNAAAKKYFGEFAGLNTNKQGLI